MVKKRSIIPGLFVLLFAAALLIGCTSEEDIMNEYANLISQKPTEKSVAEVEQYVNDHIDRLDTQDADYMLQLMDDYLYNYDETDVKYQELADQYKKYISETLYDFYMIKADEQTSPAVKDGILQHDFEGLMKRALELEAFADENKDVFRNDHYVLAKEDLEWMYKSYIDLMLKGSSVNPLFSYETGEADESATESYTALAAKNANTTTAWAAEQFLQYVDSVDGRLDFEDTVATKMYYDICAYISAEAGKKLYQ